MVKKTIGKINSDDLWEIIAKNYEFIEGAQMSNSFIILMALNQKNHKHNSNIRKNFNKFKKSVIQSFWSTQRFIRE